MTTPKIEKEEKEWYTVLNIFGLEKEQILHFPEPKTKTTMELKNVRNESETHKTTNEAELGPRRVGNAKVIFKTLLGLIGGIGGTLVLIILMLFASSVIPNLGATFGDEAPGVTPIFLYIVLVMVFLATLLGNLVPVVLFYVADREKYPRVTTNLIQGFIFNVLVFIFSIPLYLILQGASVEKLIYIVGIHFLISAFVTSVVIEVVSGKQYALVSIYGSTFGILAALLINILLLLIGQTTSARAFMLFLTLPLMWASIGFFQTAVEMLYRWVYDVYGIDFLNLEAQFEEKGE